MSRTENTSAEGWCSRGCCLLAEKRHGTKYTRSTRWGFSFNCKNEFIIRNFVVAVVLWEGETNEQTFFDSGGGR